MKDAPGLNQEQIEALDVKQHVAVIASAGAGKTTVLVERHLKVLECTEASIDQILAITFTERAAAEMRQRIEQRLQASSTSPREPALGFSALQRAPITTIHGFCHQVLRMFPAEAGLEPGFRVAEPVGQEVAIRQGVVRALDTLAQEGAPELAELAAAFSRESLHRLFEELLRRRNQIEIARTLSAQTGPLIRAHRRETARNLLYAPIWPRLQRCLVALPGKLVLSGSLGQRCRSQLDLFSRRRELGGIRFVEAIANTLKIPVRASREWKEEPDYPLLQSLWGDLRKLIRDSPLDLPAAPTLEDRLFERLFGAIQCVDARIRNDFEARKMLVNRFDFDDLLSKARLAIHKPRVAQRLSHRFPYLLVDEFQDTNSTQWDLLQPLVNAGSNLFVVGDTQQSIYRFRDADVSVFRNAVEWIRRNGRVVRLRDNYRSLPELVDFTNQVFGKIFRGGLSYEASHQEMRPRRDEEEAGRVELHFWDPADDLDEAEVCAGRIRELLDQGQNPSDIALLLRNRLNLASFERAFRSRRIPFVANGGVGFFESREVYDLRNVLSFLDRRNEVQLLGALRGRLFNFNDDDLAALRKASPSLWTALSAQATDSTPLAERSGFVLRCVHRWVGLKQSLTISELIQTILSDTGYSEIVAQSPRAAQSLGNLRKLIELSRGFESSRARSLAEFVNYLTTCEQSSSGEPEGASSEPNRVGIFTIHGAKGLQFPVVFVAGLGEPLLGQRDAPFYAERLQHEERADSFLAFRVGPTLGHPRELTHPLYRRLKKLSEYRQLAEEKRLLYVAITRARDHLILIGQRGRKLSALEWLLEAGAEESRVAPRLALSLGTAAADRPVAPVPVSDAAGVPRVGPESFISQRDWTVEQLWDLSECPRKLAFGIPSSPMSLNQLFADRHGCGLADGLPRSRSEQANSSLSGRSYHLKTPWGILSGSFDQVISEGQHWQIVVPVDEVSHRHRLSLTIQLWAASRHLSTPALSGILVNADGKALETHFYNAQVEDRVLAILESATSVWRKGDLPKTDQQRVCRECSFLGSRCPGGS